MNPAIVMPNSHPQFDEADVPQPGDEIQENLAPNALDAASETRKLAEEMHGRCRALLEELQLFRAHLKELKKEARVEVKYFKGGVESEMRILDKVMHQWPPHTSTGC